MVNQNFWAGLRPGLYYIQNIYLGESRKIWWDRECPDFRPDDILGVSMRVFMDEINIWISRESKADFPLIQWPISSGKSA